MLYHTYYISVRPLACYAVKGQNPGRTPLPRPKKKKPPPKEINFFISSSFVYEYFKSIEICILLLCVYIYIFFRTYLLYKTKQNYTNDSGNADRYGTDRCRKGVTSFILPHVPCKNLKKKKRLDQFLAPYLTQGLFLRRQPDS